MNPQTLEKLKKNPHYKMTTGQRAQHSEYNRRSMTSFGVVETHSQSIPLNDTNQEKVAINKKRKL